MFKKKYFEDNAPLLRNAFTDGNNIDMDKILQDFFDCLDGKDGGKLSEYVTKLKELRDKNLLIWMKMLMNLFSVKMG